MSVTVQHLSGGNPAISGHVLFLLNSKYLWFFEIIMKRNDAPVL